MQAVWIPNNLEELCSLHNWSALYYDTVVGGYESVTQVFEGQQTRLLQQLWPPLHLSVYLFQGCAFPGLFQQ